MKRFHGLVILVFLGFSGLIQAQENTGYKVSGLIKLSKTGKVYVRLYSGEGETMVKYDKMIDIGIENIEAGQVAFVFEHIPAGQWAIRAYQDLNGNDKFDMNIFGLKEPWGTYRHSRPRFGGPKWKEMVFEIKGDVADISLELK